MRGSGGRELRERAIFLWRSVPVLVVPMTLEHGLGHLALCVRLSQPGDGSHRSRIICSLWRTARI